MFIAVIRYLIRINNLSSGGFSNKFVVNLKILLAARILL